MEWLTAFFKANVLSVEENFTSYAYLHTFANVYRKLQTQGTVYDGTHLHF